jgi:phytoene synthase
MYSIFSPAVKPYISVSNGKFPTRKPTFTSAEVTMAPQQRSTSIFPTLPMHGIPFADLHVQEIEERQSQNKNLAWDDRRKKTQLHPMFLAEAYERCRDICEEYAKTFYLGPTSFPFFHQFDNTNQYPIYLSSLEF